MNEKIDSSKESPITRYITLMFDTDDELVKRLFFMVVVPWST